ncbi:ryanodine receptor [Trichonephila clavipes]|nr:ryanodine receptor [Trichonephila clavipes]
MVACLKRLLPIGLNLFAGREQELVQHAKDMFLKGKVQEYIFDYIKLQLTLPDKIGPSDVMSWQHYLYSKLGTKRESTQKVSPDELVEKIIDMTKVLYGLHMRPLTTNLDGGMFVGTPWVKVQECNVHVEDWREFFQLVERRSKHIKLIVLIDSCLFVENHFVNENNKFLTERHFLIYLHDQFDKFLISDLCG